MSLSERLAALAAAIGQELKARVTAEHPGLAKAWVRFGVGSVHQHGHGPGRASPGRPTVHAAHHVTDVQRLSRGCYLVHFAMDLPDVHHVWTAHAKGSAGHALRVVDGALRSPRHLELICTDADGFASEARELNLVVFR